MTIPRDNEPRGTVQRFKDAKGRTYWRARITLPDGERLWVGGRFPSELRAKEYADEKAREAERRDVTIAKMAPKAKAAGETCDAWHARYLLFCTEQGLSTVKDKRYRWSAWLAPTIGTKAPGDVTRDDIENIRDALDEAIRAYTREGPGDERIAPKTAQNIWSELTVSFGEMCNSKRRDLRAIQTDPTNGVQPPERGADKTKCYPYPSELLAVLSCELIPLEWREVHAIAAYTFARPGELRVLTWGDVDLADQTIRITKAWDYDNERIKATKTHESREVPIEAALLPLLREMHRRAKGEGLVLPVLATANDDKAAIMMRRHFALAGCNRPRLTAQNNAELRLRFRSWRDAGITWSIIRGDDIVKVQRRAGHKLIATTQRYIVEAENRGATFGTPFPPLPDRLVSASKLSSKDDGSILQVTVTIIENMYRRRDSNPHARKDGGF
jgi:integrase